MKGVRLSTLTLKFRSHEGFVATEEVLGDIHVNLRPVYPLTKTRNIAALRVGQRFRRRAQGVPAA